jgi:hypothetical protein
VHKGQFFVAAGLSLRLHRLESLYHHLMAPCMTPFPEGKGNKKKLAIGIITSFIQNIRLEVKISNRRKGD